MPRVERSDEVLQQALRPQEGANLEAMAIVPRAHGGCAAVVLELRARDVNVASTTDRRHRQIQRCEQH